MFAALSRQLTAVSDNLATYCAFGPIAYVNH